MSSAGDKLVADLVDANRILAAKGIFDAFGHVSARIGPARFLLACNLAPAQVTPTNIIEYDLDGEATIADAPRPYLERFIHGEIYRLRPDVGAVIHTHAASLLPFGVVSSAKLRPLSHMCGFLAGGAPVFEIRSAAGEETDLLIRNQELGKALAECLGLSTLILMRGHGTTVVGPDVRRAVYYTVYAEMNARVQMAAAALGEATFLTAHEAAAAQRTNDGQIDRPWNLWREEASSLSR